VAEVAGAAEGRLHVDPPLGVVADDEGEDNGADVMGCAPESDRASGKGAGLRGDEGPSSSDIGDRVRDMRGSGGGWWWR
jgi:hypothetical protein